MTFYSINERKPASGQMIVVKKTGTTFTMTGYFHQYHEDGEGTIRDAFGNLYSFTEWSEKSDDMVRIKEAKQPVISSGIKSEIATCTVHGTYKAYVDEHGASECPKCASERIERERAEWHSELNQNKSRAKIETIFNRSCVPRAFKNLSFDDYKPSCKEADEVVYSLQRYVSGFHKFKDSGASILLHGKTGTGKTMLGAIVINELMKQGHTALYIDCPGAINWIKRSWVKNPEVSQDEQISKFIEPDILMLDDLPKGCNHESERQMIWMIINIRVMELKPTITTSILNKKQLGEKVHDEIVRRLTFKGRDLNFSWSTYDEPGVLG